MIFEKPIAIYGGQRTAVGKLAGMHARVEPHTLLASSITGTLIKAEDPSNGDGAKLEEIRKSVAAKKDKLEFDDVIIGNVRNSVGNIARVAALEAGIPESVPAITIDRQCASSMEALQIAGCKLLSGGAKSIIIGGVESASQAPWMYAKTSRPFSYFEPQPFKIRISSEKVGDPPMGETAEIVSEEFYITRAAMDEFTLSSHQKAAKAQNDNFFGGEIFPYFGTLEDELQEAPEADECVRADSTLEQLAKLRPVFRKDGKITAGNASPLNDAAISAIACRQDDLPENQKGHEIMIKSIVTVGLDPNRMGLGPALAIPEILNENELDLNSIDLIEINEAFAGQVLGCLAHLQKNGLEILPEKLNIHGGALAIGHPMGATGLRLILTLGRSLRKNGLKRGIASLCIGGGQGMAALVEIPDP